MGYSHSFTIQPGHDIYASMWPGLLEDAVTIVDAVKAKGIEINGPSGLGTPRLHPSRGIAFNGSRIAGSQCDSFHLDSPAPIAGADRSCRRYRYVKTDANPYDLAVCAVLLRMKMLMPDIVAVGNPGVWDDTAAGRSLVVDLFGGPDPGPDLFADPTDGLVLSLSGWVDPQLLEQAGGPAGSR
ncbi:hypothetical protein AB0B66_10430 [Catellatospora sp. NPDC049111]|uniref:hypothetical protein n=1 Tax=Catellatospora sp. NPDC049111 TaxID=3155271 RepID=UPI0033DCBBF7